MTTGIKAFLTFLISLQITGISGQTSVLNESKSDEVDLKTVEMIVDFNMHNYVELSSLDQDLKHVVISFMVRSKDGTLLYKGHEQKGTNFIVIDVADGHVCFKCKIGNEILIDLTSKEPVSIHEWHTVYVDIEEGNGYLQVDEEDIIISNNSKPFTEVRTIGESLYIGGNPNSNDKNGLNGAIRFMKVNREHVTSVELIDMARKRDNVLGFMADPCENPIPCLDDVKCITNFGQYVCCIKDSNEIFCPSDRNNRSMYTELARTAEWQRHDVFLDFNVNSYLQLATLEPENEWLSVEIVFMTRSLNGTLLYNGQFNNGTGDFISVILKDAKVQLRYNFGNALQIVRSKHEISGHEWHVVTVEIYKYVSVWKATIQVDIQPEVSELSLTNLDHDDWDMKGPLYIGNYVGTASQEAGVEYGFNGAIMRMSLNDRLENLVYNVKGQNVLLFEPNLPLVEKYKIVN